jgi:hypothetical protein
LLGSTFAQRFVGHLEKKMRATHFHRFRTWTIGLAPAISLFALVLPPAYAANSVGWALVDQPEPAGGYTLDSRHSFNSAGGSVGLSSSGNGSYSVSFANLEITAPADIQVTAYNSANRCATRDQETSGTTVVADVECFDVRGNPTNSGFTLLYQARSAPFGSASNGLAFLQQEGTTKYTKVLVTFNSKGGQNSAVKSNKTGIGAGNYTVTLPGLTHVGGNVQISSWLSSAGNSGTAQCKVANWSASANGTVITVQCYRDDNGNPSYSAFNLAYAIGDPFGLVTPGSGPLGAYLLAGEPTSTKAYMPAIHYQYNGFRTGAMTAQKTSTGHYTVTIPGTLAYTTAVALTTAYGPGNDYCNVAGWSGGTINVVCYNQSQAFADSRFGLTFQTAK